MTLRGLLAQESTEEEGKEVSIIFFGEPDFTPMVEEFLLCEILDLKQK